ncbi:hypothetical protein [Hyphococcus sp.]
MDGGLRSWIEAGRYTPNSSSTATQIEIENFDFEALTDSIAFDYARFALSCYESFSVCRLDNQNHSLFSWPLLKLYYAAFFGCHAIMRSQGYGIIKLEKRQTDYINSILTITTGADPQIKTGMYSFSASTGVLRLSPLSSGKRGVHEEFWFEFVQFLNTYSNEAQARGAPDASQFIAGTQAIDDALAGGWFSAYRNEINYQHKHNVWLPIRRKDDRRNSIEAVAITNSNSILLPGTGKKDVRDFIRIAHFFTMLSIEISEFIAARSTRAAAFGQVWRRVQGLI